MKKLSLAALALMGLLFAGPALANEGHYKDGMDDKKMDKALEKLDLSADQRSRINTARRDHKEAMEAIVSRKHAHLDTLEAQVGRQASDSELKDTLREIKKDKADLQDQMEKFHDKLEDILTPTQKAKLILHKKKMKR